MEHETFNTKGNILSSEGQGGVSSPRINQATATPLGLVMKTDTAIPERLADYALVRETGKGAMSTVYEARDANNQRVAVKVLHSPTTLSQEQRGALVDRLEREARVMLRLAHPNVVRLFDVGQQADEHFIVMEFLDGQTLRDRLDGGPLSLLEASRIVEQTAAALDAVHAQGIVHRDVKPSNIMLVGNDIVKLMDFGVARQGDDTTITQTGMIVGSPAYMSPEQVRGEENTASTDLWALGIVLYEMLAGHSPFTGPNVSRVLYRVAHETLAPVPGLSHAVQQVLRRALDKNPAKRYPTGRALADAFRTAALSPEARFAPSLPMRSRWPWVAVPVAILLALLVGTVFWTRSHPRLEPSLLPPAKPFFSATPSRAAQRSALSAPTSDGAAPTLGTRAPTALDSSEAATTPFIQEVTPSLTVTPKPAVGKQPLQKQIQRKSSSAAFSPRRAKSTRATRRVHRTPRRHEPRSRRVLNRHPRYPAQSQHWQNMERFIYHDYY